MVTAVLSHPDCNHPLSLWSTQEPKYFHFVEDLLKPYERAMQTETCGTEVQELVCLFKIK